MQVLSYLDFFPTGVQRVAVTTAANMCRGLTSDSLDMVQEAVPMLTNLLQYQVGWRVHVLVRVRAHVCAHMHVRVCLMSAHVRV